MSNSNLDPIRILHSKSQDSSLPIEAIRIVWNAMTYLNQQSETEEKIGRWIEGRL